MNRDEYDDAITFYQLARNKDPRNSMVLNNLSFALLKTESSKRNPEQALILVDQAIYEIANSRTLDAGQREAIAASLKDTRGVALIQLGRFSDAVAELESASVLRPNSIEILKRLLQCYQELENEAAVVTLQKRIDELSAKTKNSESAQ